MKRAGRTLRGAGRCAPLIIAIEGTAYFDRQFVFISGSLKNDVHTHVSHIKLQTSMTQR